MSDLYRLYRLNETDGVKDLIDWLRDNDVLIPVAIDVAHQVGGRYIWMIRSDDADPTAETPERPAEWRGKGGVFWPKVTG